MKIQRPETNLSVFSYFQFREFLRDWYREWKESGFSISYKLLAQTFDLGSHSHLYDVIQGRPISQKYLPKYLNMLELEPGEARYFVAMVDYEQSSDVQTKLKAFQKLQSLSPNQQLFLKEKEALDFFSDLRKSTLLHLLAWKSNEKDCKVLARYFSPPESPKKIEKDLVWLVKRGWVKWENSEWILLEKHLKFTDSGKKMLLQPYHIESMEKGKEQYLDRYEEQEFSTLTLGTTKDTQEKIKEKIRNLRKEIVSMVQNEEEVETVLQVNFQIFEPLRQYHPRPSRNAKTTGEEP